jgi:hypothetical protein
MIVLIKGRRHRAAAVRGMRRSTAKKYLRVALRAR